MTKRATSTFLSVNKPTVMYETYFKFIQFSLDIHDGTEFSDGPALKHLDWGAFYEFAVKQTLAGTTFDGIQKLPKEAAPDLKLLMLWFGTSRKIKIRNERMNAATAAIYSRIKESGFNCCVLKGQGNAAMYPNPLARTPGDIDIWVDASREEIRQLAHSLTESDGKIDDESYNHIGLTIRDVTVELHFTPGYMASPVYNKRLQKWFRDNVCTQCRNMQPLPYGAGEVAVPTAPFNAVYQLCHLYHHYFYEGIGLRQIVDYYFVMTNYGIENNGKLKRDLKRLGLWKFARAMMYVLHKVMNLPEEKMIAPMDATRGSMLLEDILSGGNFGRYNERHKWGKDTYGADGFKHGAIGHNLLRLFRDTALLRYYPAEALSEPLFRLWHWWWRRKS